MVSRECCGDGGGSVPASEVAIAVGFRSEQCMSCPSYVAAMDDIL